MKKNELKAGDIVTLKNGDRLIYDGEDNFTDLNDNNNNGLCDLSDLTDNMKYEGYSRNYEYDVMKVERPVNYLTMFESDETVKEMTLQEVCDVLGYDIKIIKEED